MKLMPNAALPAARVTVRMTVRAMALVLGLGAAALPAVAQNVAIVNGKPVPMARVDALLKEAERAGQPTSPELQKQVRDQVVLREIFVQEAERQGLAATPDYRSRMELARQSLLIRELFDDWKRKHPVSDADAQVEYDKFKAQAGGLEYRARHILVETEDEAKAVTAQLQRGGNFEELAKKHSKDPGSAENGGDLDFAKADAYVPEFGQAMVKLGKGETTAAPVKSPFGWHIIRVEDTREAPFPAFADVKDQIKQRIEQVRMQDYQEELRTKAKTDYNFGP